MKDKSLWGKQIYRIQVFMVEKTHSSSNLKHLELLYSSDKPGRKSLETYHTQIATLSKKG